MLEVFGELYYIDLESVSKAIEIEPLYEVTGNTEQSINLLANDTPLQLPTFRHEVMPSSQSHQVGQTPTRSHHGNEGGPAAQQHQ